MIKFMRSATLSVALAGALLMPAVAAAQSAANFYKGRDVTINVGSGAGGGYDTYTRALARHWGRHIPGNPNFIIKNRPGAGGIIMLNYLAHKGKRDGSELGAGFAHSVIEPVLDKGKVTKYDSRKLNWIGSISGQAITCFTWKAHSKVKNIRDARSMETIMAATGTNNPSTFYANIFNMKLGTKFKVITGYTTSETTLAIERGEADGTCLSYATLVARKPDWVEGKKVNWIAVVSEKPDPNLPGVPTAFELLKTDDDKNVFRILISQLYMGRPYVAPEGVPADRVAALRAGFLATMKDPAFLAEAKKLKMFVDPSDHRAMEKLVADTYAAPDDVVNKTIALIKEAKENAKKSISIKKKKK